MKRTMRLPFSNLRDIKDPKREDLITFLTELEVFLKLLLDDDGLFSNLMEERCAFA